jgi:hypothetical protein
MAIYQYAIAQGHDAVSLDNIEDIISHAPTAQPLKRGSVKRRTLNQAVQRNGTIPLEWNWAAISRADIDVLLSYLGTDLEVGSGEVTIRTRGPRDNWITVNATMDNPESGDDWERGIGGHGAADPFKLPFTVIGRAAGYDELLLETGFNLLLESGDKFLLES